MIISCEGRSVKSTVHNNTLEPEFKTSGVFYRKKPAKPITVEVRQTKTRIIYFICILYLSVSERHGRKNIVLGSKRDPCSEALQSLIIVITEHNAIKLIPIIKKAR